MNRKIRLILVLLVLIACRKKEDEQTPANLSQAEVISHAYIKGVVYDSLSGVTMAGFVISMDNRTNKGVSDNNGRFVTSIAWGGRYIHFS